MFRSFIRFLCLVAAIWCPLRSVSAAISPPVPHQVLAFYYGWYDPVGGGSWLPGARWTPTLGAYDSSSISVITQQVAEARKAGITGFIVSWWPGDTFTTNQLQVLLPIAAHNGLSISVLVEDITGSGTTVTASDVIANLEDVLVKYRYSPAWLTVGGGPVLFIYTRALARVSTAGWATALARVRGDYPKVVILSASNNGAPFDGFFPYSADPWLHDGTLAEIEARYRKIGLYMNQTTPMTRISCLTVQAGYDDSHDLPPRPLPRPILQRYDGATYRATWRAALAVNPDWVLISTFNEWFEGTQIEPSVQFGTQALSDTTAFSARFLAAPPRPAASAMGR